MIYTIEYHPSIQDGKQSLEDSLVLQQQSLSFQAGHSPEMKEWQQKEIKQQQ